MIVAQQWLDAMTASRQTQIRMLQEEITQLKRVAKSKLWQLGVDQIGLSPRTANALRRLQINIVGDLMLADDKGNLMHKPGIGDAAMIEIRCVLDDVMYSLHDKPSWMTAMEATTTN